MGLSIHDKDARLERDGIPAQKRTWTEAVLLWVLKVLYEYMVIVMSTAAGVQVDAMLFGGLTGGTWQGVVDVFFKIAHDHPWSCVCYILGERFVFSESLISHGMYRILYFFIAFPFPWKGGEMCAVCLMSQVLVMDAYKHKGWQGWPSSIILRSAVGFTCVLTVFMGAHGCQQASYEAALKFASDFATAMAAATGASTFMWHLRELVEQRRAGEIADLCIDLVIDVFRCVFIVGLVCFGLQLLSLVLFGGSRTPALRPLFKFAFFSVLFGMVTANLMRAFMWLAAIKNREVRAVMWVCFLILAAMLVYPFYAKETKEERSIGWHCRRYGPSFACFGLEAAGAYRPPGLRRTIGRMNLKLCEVMYGHAQLLRPYRGITSVFVLAVQVRVWLAGVTFMTLVKQFYTYRIIIKPLSIWAGLFVEECTTDPAKRSINGCTASLLVSSTVAPVIALMWPMAEVVSTGMLSWVAVASMPMQTALVDRWKDVMASDAPHEH